MEDTHTFHWSEYIKAGSEAFVLLKTLYPLLPTQSRDEIEAKIEAAEIALQKANVALAKIWEFPLCQCTFPPQIMLWIEVNHAHVCPNPECGRKRQKPGPVLVQRSRGARRRVAPYENDSGT